MKDYYEIFSFFTTILQNISALCAEIKGRSTKFPAKLFSDFQGFLRNFSFSIFFRTNLGRASFVPPPPGSLATPLAPSPAPPPPFPCGPFPTASIFQFPVLRFCPGALERGGLKFRCTVHPYNPRANPGVGAAPLSTKRIGKQPQPQKFAGASFFGAFPPALLIHIHRGGTSREPGFRSLFCRKVKSPQTCVPPLPCPNCLRGEMDRIFVGKHHLPPLRLPPPLDLPRKCT